MCGKYVALTALRQTCVGCGRECVRIYVCVYVGERESERDEAVREEMSARARVCVAVAVAVHTYTTLPVRDRDHGTLSRLPFQHRCRRHRCTTACIDIHHRCYCLPVCLSPDKNKAKE